MLMHLMKPSLLTHGVSELSCLLYWLVVSEFFCETTLVLILPSEIPHGTSQQVGAQNTVDICQVQSFANRLGTSSVEMSCVSFFDYRDFWGWLMLITNFSALICGLLTVDPSNRMTLPEVYGHPWCMRYKCFSVV